MRSPGLSGNGSSFIPAGERVGCRRRALFPLSGVSIFFSLFLFFSLLLQAAPAGAQLALESEPPRPSEPEPPRFHLTPALDVDYEYDDNIFFRTFNRESDFITRVRPKFSFLVEQERVRWEADVRADFAFYQEHSDLSTWNRAQSLDTRLTLRPSGIWTFEFFDTFLHSIDPVEQLNLLLRRTEYFTNTVSLKGAYRFSPRLTLEAEVSNRVTQFKDPNFIDVDENEVRGAMTYLLTPLDKVTPEYRYRNFYFENRGNTEVHTGALKVEHRFTQTLTGRGMAGLLAIIDRGQEQNDILLGLGAEQRYSAVVVFTADFLRDVSVVGGLSGVFITNTFSGSAIFHLTSWFDSIMGASWAFQQPLLSNRVNLDTIGVRVEEQVRLASWLRAVASYSYRRQNLHGSPRDIYDNRVFIGLTALTTYPDAPGIDAAKTRSPHLEPR
ncbi:MAG: outer membrane beta-barrel protein [Nitrospirae bacterium]|nr:outer membrane beta-barrel protein [Candidatus Manganitrophaceae bacterium]